MLKAKEKLIKFRSHQKKDIPYRVKWLNNIKATKFVIDNPKKKTTLREQVEWFDNYLKNKKKVFFTILYNNQPIGFMGLSGVDLQKKTGGIFIMIGENKYRSKGLGEISLRYLINYGFRKLNLKELNLEVNQKNLPAINLYKKLGFIIIKRIEKELYMKLLKKD